MTDPQANLLVSHYSLRKAIGWLGMLLPFILLIGNYIINQSDALNNPTLVCDEWSADYQADGSWKTSISNYYYTTVGELFTGMLIAVSLFLFCYKGHPKRPGERGPSDRTLTNLAAAAALGVVIFPTGSDFEITDNLRTFVSNDLAETIHFSSAAVFFASLAFICIVNFRRAGDGTFGGKDFHGLYLACGIGMLSCCILIAIYSFLLKYKWAALDAIHPVYTFEAIALVFFGISWLTKGRVDFKYIPRLLRLVK